jgi:hypothetical protein
MYQCLHAIYNNAYLVYAPFMPYRLHLHQKLTRRFTAGTLMIRIMPCS